MGMVGLESPILGPRVTRLGGASVVIQCNHLHPCFTRGFCRPGLAEQPPAAPGNGCSDSKSVRFLELSLVWPQFSAGSQEPG